GGGVPPAAGAGGGGAAGAGAFAGQIGSPLTLKPRGGAGARDTRRADDPAGLDHALGIFGGQGADSIAVEEFVEGHEGFYDTITVGGQVAADFGSDYFPSVLAAMTHRWGWR